MSRSDEELFLDFKEQRVLKALEELIKRHNKPLVNFFYRFLWDEAMSQDLAQEVFIKLAISVKNYTPQARFTTFLYRIAHNLLIDHLRHKQTADKELSLDTRLTVGQGKASSDEDNTLSDLIDSQSKSPLQEIIEQEKGAIIRKRLLDLSVEQRLVVELSVFKQMTYIEIAETLDIPINTVKSRMRWALIHLSRRKPQTPEGHEHR